MGKPKLDIGRPTGAFNRLSQTYEQQRAAGQFPAAAFNKAREIGWVHSKMAVDAEMPSTHPILSDGELSSLAGKPVWLFQLASKESSPKVINGTHNYETARANWRETKQIMLSKVTQKFWDKIKDPRDNIKESNGKGLAAISYQLDMKEDPKFAPQPPLPADHPLAKLRQPSLWPHRWPPSRVSDITIIRLYPARFGPKVLWQMWTGMPANIVQYIPANGDLQTLIVGHELRHAMQPYPGGPTKFESYFGEVDADRYAIPYAQKLGVPQGTVEAFLAGRCVDSFCTTPRTWSGHTTTPAILENSIAEWPVQRVEHIRFELRARTAMLLTAQKFDLTSAEIKAALGNHYPKDNPARKAHIKALMKAARKADDKVSKKAGIRAERRLLALKKIWNSQSVKMDKDTTYFAGLVLEGASLYWPDLMKTRTQFRQVHTRSFTRQNAAHA